MGDITIEHRNVRLRVGDITSRLLREHVQRGRTAYAQEAAPGRVGIDVGYRVLLEFLRVFLGPLRRTEQRGFLAIPGEKHQCPRRAPSGFGQFTD